MFTTTMDNFNSPQLQAISDHLIMEDSIPIANMALLTYGISNTRDTPKGTINFRENLFMPKLGRPPTNFSSTLSPPTTSARSRPSPSSHLPPLSQPPALPTTDFSASYSPLRPNTSSME